MEGLVAIRPMTDRPDRRPRTRIGFVQKPDIDGDPMRVIMGYPGYGKQPGENWGGPLFQGERRRTPWHQEGGVWVMETELLIDLLVDGRPGPLNPPAIGWSMTTVGFGLQFPDAAEPSSPSGDDTNAIRIAFHPSGLAVLVAPMDSNGDLEVWRWIPGQGFGSKYPVVVMSEAEDDIGAPFEFPRIDQSGNGQYAFSPDGNWLAIAGDQGTTLEGAAMPLVVVPFSLSTGIDILSSVYPSGDHNALGDANCVAWSPDGNHVGIGADGPPYIRFWNWTGSGFGAAEADPASPPADPVSVMAFNEAGTFLVAGTFFSTTGADNPKAWSWTPNVGWGSALAPPADTLGSGSDVQAVQFHAAGRRVLVVDVTGPIYIYEFDQGGGGSWGARTEIDDWNADAMTPLGGSFAPDGTMIVVIGEASGDVPTARLYAFNGTTATFVEETTWAGSPPQTFASVEWRP